MRAEEDFKIWITPTYQNEEQKTLTDLKEAVAEQPEIWEGEKYEDQKTAIRRCVQYIQGVCDSYKKGEFVLQVRVIFTLTCYQTLTGCLSDHTRDG
jgi:hypothetical protein